MTPRGRAYGGRVEHSGSIEPATRMKVSAKNLGIILEGIQSRGVVTRRGVVFF
jgi:hypothetical protein